MNFCRACLAVALIALAACAEGPAGEGAATTGAAVELAFADVLAPSVLDLEARAAIAGEGEAEGLWAAVPGLPRPERGRLLSPGTGRSVVVPLFRGGDLRISRAAAAALGLESSPDGGSAPVSIVAVRSEIRLVGNGAR